MSGPLPVNPGDPIGSPRLAAALASGDADAIGRALRHDVVVVPLVRAADGTVQVRVLPADDGRLDVAVFSSSSSLARFIRDETALEFDVQRGTALGGFLEQHHDRLARVLFDPGGPHPVAAAVDAVIESLRPRPDDDDVGWIAGRPPAADVENEASAMPQRTTVDFRWAMPLLGWQRVVPADLRSHPALVTKQLARSARRMPRTQRDPVAAWLTETALDDARQDSLREVALLAEGRGDDAFLVLAARHWLVADGSPDHDFDAVVARIQAGLGPDDELAAGGEELVGRSVRHTSVTEAAGLPGGSLVTVEYLLAFPDGHGLCRVRFAAPGRGARDRLQRLSAPIVAGGEWVVRGPV